MHRRVLLLALAAAPVGMARAHHGWSSFDQSRPLYVEGAAARVRWRNPHVEFELEVDAALRLPADLTTRVMPAQVAAVDAAALLKAARLPTRQDKRWEIELAPLSRVEAWKIPELKSGDRVAILGFTFIGEKGSAIIRAEFIFIGGQAFGLRSNPA
jgi:Family of unknown function (DUF6152)